MYLLEELVVDLAPGVVKTGYVARETSKQWLQLLCAQP
jgi:hypothetical protein